MKDPAQRFLIVRLSSIGDIVHALPAAAALAKSFPRADIDWVVERPHALLLSGNPYLDRVVVLDTLGWRKRLAYSATWRAIGEGIGELRRLPYDAALDFQGLWKSAAVAWLSAAPERLGFAEPWLREPGAAVLYTRQVSPPEQVHVVEQNLALVRHLGVHSPRWEFPLPRNQEDDEYVTRRLDELKFRDFVIINPGGGWRSKCWSPENYAALIRQLRGILRAQIILTGSPAEEPTIEGILQSAEAQHAHYMATNLTQFIALARRARLFVGGDTGPLHLAAAIGTPIVGIYGPTDPVRNGPFAADDIALWNPQPINHTRRAANPAYLAGISVESVVAAVQQRLERAHG